MNNKKILQEKHQPYGYHGLLAVNVLDDMEHNRIPFSNANRTEKDRDKEYELNKFYKYYLSLQNGKYNSPYVQNKNFDAILNINLKKVKDYNSKNFEIGPVQFPGEPYEAEERIVVKSENISSLSPMNKFVESIHIYVPHKIDDMYLSTIWLYEGIIENAFRLNIPLFFYNKIGYFRSQMSGITGDKLKEYYNKLSEKEDELINNHINEVCKHNQSLKEECQRKNLIRKEYPLLTTLTYMLSLINDNYIPIKYYITEDKNIDNEIKEIIKNSYKELKINEEWIDEYYKRLQEELNKNNFPYGFEMMYYYTFLEGKYKNNYNMLIELNHKIKKVLQSKR